jgi:dihydroorotase
MQERSKQHSATQGKRSEDPSESTKSLPIGAGLPERLEIKRPDDWHLHLRDGEMLARVLPYTARRFGRAVVMPNLAPPVVTTGDAERYAERIRALLPADAGFEPLMTLYLTDSMTPEEIERAARSSDVVAVKLYPKGATTNSAQGVAELEGLSPVLEALERVDLPLLVHGESTASDCDVFDREQRFLDDTLVPLVDRFEGLRVVFEHITTAEAAAFVEASSSRIAATITPQHLLMNRNALFEGGLRPHHYCLPVLKREQDRLALVRAATSGDPSFFLGTDSAPHERGTKESACGCAGIFSAPIAIELYAEAFARAGALHRLEEFASEHGADFYRRPHSTERIVLERADWSGPEWDGQGQSALHVFWAGESLLYRSR